MGGEIRVDLEMIAAITQWPIPTNMTKVRSFMVVAEYLRKFIVKLSTIETSLHALITKGNKFHWGNPKK